MKTLELEKQRKRLVALFAKTQTATNGDLEIQAHWAKYLCVLSAGFLENALSEIYIRYCVGSSSPKVGEFSRGTLRKIQNPKTNKFLEIAGSFDKQWRVDLEAFFESEGRKDAVNSIMANRHLIAHGKDTSVSLVRVKEYLLKSIEVIEFIETQLGLAEG